MADTNVKQKIAGKIKDSNNILVTVNSNPSVDELSAALGITLLINKLDKHATCVFSGEVPSAMEFLDPEKTFEGTVDSLRDFIIALDKEKADHLRYKVEGDVVKIFITPYRTVINQDDLDFSQGDYNVEFVLAIGVQSEDDLDKALESHGRILHDATVASVSLDGGDSLGSLHWSDRDASSYSEMLAALGRELKDGKNLFDEQVSTAFLTGIVAATNRFSNSNTTSDAMTLAAYLMSTGANQQLIAAKLEEASEIPSSAPMIHEREAEPKQHPQDTDLEEGKAAKLRTTETKSDEKPKKPRDGTLSIEHEPLRGDIDEVTEQVALRRQQEAANEAEEELAARLAKGISEAKGARTPSSLHRELESAARALPPQPIPVPPAPAAIPSVSVAESGQSEPTLGGTLNATTEQAAKDKQRQIDDDRNRTILSHDGAKYINDKPSYQSPINAVSQEADAREHAEVQDIFAAAPTISTPDLPSLEDIQPPRPTSEPTLEEIDRQNRKHTEAVHAVHAAFEETPIAPPSQPHNVAPLESHTASPISPESASAPAPGGLPPLPPLPPMPDFASSSMALPPSAVPTPPPMGLPDRLEETLPPLPPSTTLPVAQPVAPVASDPGQFHIPGQ